MAEHGILAEFRVDGGAGVCGGICDDTVWRKECEREGVEDLGRVAWVCDCGGVDCYGACGTWRRCTFGVGWDADGWTQAYLYDHDSRFFVGWELGKSWVLCTVSWAVLAVDISGVVGAALFLPKEDDYEPIPEPR